MRKKFTSGLMLGALKRVPAVVLATLFAAVALAAVNFMSLSSNGTPITTTANDLIVAGPNASQLQDEQFVAAPVYASGGCATTPVITGSAYLWTLTNGATGCASNTTITLTFPTAGNGGVWACTAFDSTAPTTTMVEQSAAASATSVAMANYTRTTGVALIMVGSHVIIGSCKS